MDNRLRTPATVLQVAFGLMATLAGLDKFFNVLADWSSYVSPLAIQVLPIPVDAFMQLVGVVEMMVGVSILALWPAIGAYVASLWLLLVAGNLLAGGHLDVAVRDAVLAIGAFALARLIEVEQADALGSAARRSAPQVPA